MHLKTKHFQSASDRNVTQFHRSFMKLCSVSETQERTSFCMNKLFSLAFNLPIYSPLIN